MAKQKGIRAGGKVTGSHTTVVPAAAEVVDIAEKCTAVNKIVLGYIKAGLPSAKGLRKVKISEDGASLLLSVRDNTTHQELHLYGTDLATVKDELASKVRGLGFKVVV